MSTRLSVQTTAFLPISHKPRGIKGYQTGIRPPNKIIFCSFAYTVGAILHLYNFPFYRSVLWLLWNDSESKRWWCQLLSGS